MSLHKHIVRYIAIHSDDIIKEYKVETKVMFKV